MIRQGLLKSCDMRRADPESSSAGRHVALGLAGWVSSWEAVVLSPLRCLGRPYRTWRAARAGDGVALGGAELRRLSRGFGRSVAARLGWLLRSCGKHARYQSRGRPLGLRAAREGACISCISTGKLRGA